MANRKNSNELGFTLVELMVAVAIIGILCSIAIPSYQGYTSKARQTEAKLQLASVYTAETTYFLESATFTTCLSDVGFDHSFTQQFYYAVGFATASTSCGLSGSSDCQFTYSTFTIPTPCQAGAFPAGSFWPATVSANGTAPVSLGAFTGGVTTTVNGNHFTAAAMGNVSSLGTSTPDTWTINELRTLSHVLGGL